MKLVYINPQFLQHLHALDPHGVLYDQGKFIRPYIGPVLTVNGKNYYAPLSRDHSRSGYKAPNSQPIVVKLITAQGQYVGKLKLNNMLPVPESLLEDFSPEAFLDLEPLYAQIVNKQRCAVGRNILQIQKKSGKALPLRRWSKRAILCWVLCQVFSAWTCLRWLCQQGKLGFRLS